MIAGLLHTVPSLAATFDGLVAESLPGTARQHVVDAWLLETAIRAGVTPAVEERVARHLTHLAACGADAVLVTCSSIGEAAERASAGMTIPVLRIDDAMADEAVRLAGPGTAEIAVFATNTATLAPTTRLIARHATTQGLRPTISTTVVEGAAAARSRGDAATHDRLITDAVRRAARSASVVVLAQASMADAAGNAGLGVPVLTSPRGGIERLRAALTPGDLGAGSSAAHPSASLGGSPRTTPDTRPSARNSGTPASPLGASPQTPRGAGQSAPAASAEAASAPDHRATR